MARRDYCTDVTNFSCWGSRPCCPAAFMGKSHHSLAVTRVGFCFHKPPWLSTAAREEMGKKLNLSSGQVKRKTRMGHSERDKLEKNCQEHTISQ